MQLRIGARWMNVSRLSSLVDASQCVHKAASVDSVGVTKEESNNEKAAVLAVFVETGEGFRSLLPRWH
eukprot:2493011-Amphidinium_carterae.1